MILPLDHFIFGNGYGLKTPYFNDAYYWLSGELYKYNGWLGSQFSSFQWTHPKPHERRILLGREFKPGYSERRIGRVIVSWCMSDMSDDISEAQEQIRVLKSELDRL